MGNRFKIWSPRQSERMISIHHVIDMIRQNRDFKAVEKLDYGDYGLEKTLKAVLNAIHHQHRIALYADYDVDGTMSAVSWIWFLRAIGYSNFLHYIPCRFREGYGVNLKAIQHLVENEGAQLIITMDTGITANVEAEFCRQRGVEFICTDHHKIQPERMPDCIILNPKLHPDANYQELCGCGVTFVLLRKLGAFFPQLSPALWTDLLALAGIATICDVVPLNGVNHKLARLGVAALMRSNRPIFSRLRSATSTVGEVADEKDIGFRIGPRINAVGRLEHADKIISAFEREDSEMLDELVMHMESCNHRRRQIQQSIVAEARAGASAVRDESPVLFLGGDWHPGVVGIAASKIAEEYWKPVWLFHRGESQAKGSARSIPGFDVTAAMSECQSLFTKFGGHRAAGGFSFAPENEDEIRTALEKHGTALRAEAPELWISQKAFDGQLDLNDLSLDLTEALGELKPFGHGFDEPVFKFYGRIAEVKYLKDRSTGENRHTIFMVVSANGPLNRPYKLIFFNETIPLERGEKIEVLATVVTNQFRGQRSVELHGIDWQISQVF